ncbi:MAG: acetyl-CoA carboxylase biotin carboxyl carrier protein subunit [Dehalococcoidia bacterium]|jgi:biotin carboxyl carrier protein|nr:MAG: acetyl-CoA carboxylase biotin carboxyl carrier protein subunit [Dehalococcoidia bacterium]
MKYTADVDGKRLELEIFGDETDLRVATPDGEQHGSLTRHDRGRYVLRLGDRVIEGYVTPTEDGYVVVYRGRAYPVVVTDERARTLSQLGGAKHGHTGGTVKAPMPGLVKAVNVKPGDAVQRGASLVILEAMKMENDLTAPGAGTVKEVRVSAGDKVDQGQVLVVLE